MILAKLIAYFVYKLLLNAKFYYNHDPSTAQHSTYNFWRKRIIFLTIINFVTFNIMAQNLYAIHLSQVKDVSVKECKLEATFYGIDLQNLINNPSCVVTNNTIYTDNYLLTTNNTVYAGIGSKHYFHNPNFVGINTNCNTTPLVAAKVALASTSSTATWLDKVLPIVNRDIAIIEGNSVKQWNADMELYTELSADSTKLGINTLVDAWYYNMASTNIGSFSTIHNVINNSNALGTNTENLLLEARYLNETITQGDQWELNYQHGLNYYLNYRLEPNMAFTTTDIDWITTAAEECEANYGLAVHYGRYMYNQVVGARNFMDRQLCNPADSKGGTTSLEELQQLQALSQNALTKLALEKETTVYMLPNPATTAVTLYHNCVNITEGVLQVCDVSDNIVLQQSFTTAIPAHTIPIAHLPTGIYMYKCILPSCGVYNGKIIKQ